MATIKIRRSTTAGAAPTSLVTGELAINEADGALFYRNSGGTVSRLVSPQQGITFSGQATSSLIGRTVLLAGSTATTVTLDTGSSIPTGATVFFVRTGSGSVTFAAGSGGALYAFGGTSLAQQYGMAVATKISANDWSLQILSTTTPTATAGAFSGDSVLAVAQDLRTRGEALYTGGSLTLNSLALGNMDFIVKRGAQTISSFTASDWFTSTEDTRSAWVLVDGNLTINSGITFRPSVRKLFMVVYVEGDLTLNGTISMSLRGANHSGTGNSGGATTKQAIRVATGTFSGTTNPTIAATGGSGGASGAAGGTATLGSGGGGGGGNGGALGAAGTAFSGGAGGGGFGGTPFSNAAAGNADGGAGGGGSGGAGGVGNPNGSGSTSGIISDTGTGGTLIVIVNGAIGGSGSIVANGGGMTSTGTITGGASGGGVVILMRKSGSGPTLSAAGGTSTGGSANGGAGGAGATATYTLP